MLDMLICLKLLIVVTRTYALSIPETCIMMRSRTQFCLSCFPYRCSAGSLHSHHVYAGQVARIMLIFMTCLILLWIIKVSYVVNLLLGSPLC